MIPGSDSVPMTVCVFPLPVAPYAKMVALNPFKTWHISGLTSYSKISACVDAAEYRLNQGKPSVFFIGNKCKCKLELFKMLAYRIYIS
jgi:hypothetical protein